MLSLTNLSIPLYQENALLQADMRTKKTLTVDKIPVARNTMEQYFPYNFQMYILFMPHNKHDSVFKSKSSLKEYMYLN